MHPSHYKFRLSYDALNVPGTARVIAKGISDVDGDVRRCYLGDIIPVIISTATDRRKGVFTFKVFPGPTFDLPTFIADTQARIEADLEAFYRSIGQSFPPDAIDIQIVEIGEAKETDDRLRFSIYLECPAFIDDFVSSEVLASVLEEIFAVSSKGIDERTIDRIQHITPANIDGLVFMPIYAAEYMGNRMLLDLRCSLQVQIDSDDLPRGLSVPHIKEMIAQQITDYFKRNIGESGAVRDYSIKSIVPRRNNVENATYTIDRPYMNPTEGTGYRVEYSGDGIEGTALAVARYFVANQFEVRKAFIGEQDVSITDGRSRAIFKVFDRDYNRSQPKNAATIAAEIQKTIEDHYLTQGIPIGASIKVDVTSLDQHDPESNRCYLSCQIESEDMLQFIDALLDVISTPDVNPYGLKLGITQMNHTERYAPPRFGNYGITDVNIIYECIPPSDEPNLDYEERQMLYLQRWLGDAIKNLQGVRWVSVKPIQPNLSGIIFVPEFN